MVLTVASEGDSVVTVSDAAGNSASLTVHGHGPLAWAACPTGLAFQEDYTFKVSGGIPPVAFSVVSGGGAIDAATGAYQRAWYEGSLVVRASDGDDHTIDCTVTLDGGTAQLGPGGAAGLTYPVFNVVFDTEDAFYFGGSTEVSWPSYTLQGAKDLVVVKADRVGRPVWSRQLGSGGSDEGGQIALSHDRQYVYTLGTVTQGVGGLSPIGGKDVYLAKLKASDGSVVWEKQWGSAAADEAIDLRVSYDGTDHVWIGGTTLGTVRTPLVNQGGKDVFVARFAGETGAEEFSDMLGDPNDEELLGGFAVDQAGNVLLGIRVHNTLDGQTFAGANPMILVSYDGSWSRQWVVSTGCSSADAGHVDFVGGDRILNSFSCTDSLASAPNASTFYVTVMKLVRATGATVWTVQEGATGNNYNSGFAVLGNGDIVVTATSFGASYADLTNPTPADYNGVAFKLNADGVTQWRKYEGPPENSGFFRPAKRLTDDKVIVGNTNCSYASSGFNPEQGPNCFELWDPTDGHTH